MSLWFIFFVRLRGLRVFVVARRRRRREVRSGEWDFSAASARGSRAPRSRSSSGSTTSSGAPTRRNGAPAPIDVETVDALEELLISADIGVAATDRIIAAVKAQSRNGASLRDLVKQEIRDVFAAVDTPIAVDVTARRSR